MSRLATHTQTVCVTQSTQYGEWEDSFVNMSNSDQQSQLWRVFTAFIAFIVHMACGSGADFTF